MVAIALPTTTAPHRHRRSTLPSGGAGGGHRLALVPRSSAMPTLRPIASAIAVVALGLAVLLAGAYLVRTPAPTPGAASAAGSASYVAGEGDTMWSIAVAHAPAGEAASYVEALVAANGAATVVPGQTVTLPAP